MEDKNLEIKIMKMIIEKYKQAESNTIIISNKDIEDKKLTISSVAKNIINFEELGFLKIQKKPVANDFSFPWFLEITQKGTNYFKEKKHNKWLNFKDSWRTFVPTILSTISIIISIISLIRNF